MLELLKNNASLLVDSIQMLVAGANLWTALFAAISYILLSWGLYSMAKRRKISKPWLAWLPFGNLWILGSLSDQYAQLVLAKEKSNRRVRLLWIGVVAVVLLVAAIVLITVGLAYIIENAPNMSLTAQIRQKLEGLTGDALTEAYLELMTEMVASDAQLARDVTAGLIALCVILILMTVAVIDLAVEKYKALFDIYASCLPKHRVWFLVVSIVLGAEAIFVFICRKQDQGMPHDKKGRICVI